MHKAIITVIVCASFVGGAAMTSFIDRSEHLFSLAFSFSEDCGSVVNGEWVSDSNMCSLASWYVYTYRGGDV